MGGGSAVNKAICNIFIWDITKIKSKNCLDFDAKKSHWPIREYY
jgi:hypothetical protein